MENAVRNIGSTDRALFDLATEHAAGLVGETPIMAQVA